MIRPATMDDVDAIVEMARKFYPASGYAEIGPMADVAPAGLAIVCMQTGVALVAERGGQLVGMVILAVTPFEFNVELEIAHELAFWIEPEHRGGMLAARLVRAAEDACRERGVRALRMAKLASSGDDVGRLYQALGFKPSESYFSKVF